MANWSTGKPKIGDTRGWNERDQTGYKWESTPYGERWVQYYKGKARSIGGTDVFSGTKLKEAFSNRNKEKIEEKSKTHYQTESRRGHKKWVPKTQEMLDAEKTDWDKQFDVKGQPAINYFTQAIENDLELVDFKRETLLKSRLSFENAYQFEDAKGNLIEGTISDHLQVTSGASKQVTLNLTSVLDSEGFNTSDASKLKIRVWRTNKIASYTAGDEFTQTFYLVGSVNNGTATILDDVEEYSADIEFYSFPSNDPDLPVENCKYVTVHQNMLFLSGNKAKPNTVYYSDILAPEGFPSTDNAFDVDSGLGQVITGISSLSSTFFVFHKNSIHAVTGDVGSDIFKVDLVSNEGGIGCEAFHTIQELKGNLVFLSEKGIYGVSRVGELVEISSIISPDFESISKSFNFKKAVAFNWGDKELLILHLPVEQAATGPKLATSTDSEIFIFDYYRQAWLKWSNVDFSGGIVNLDKKIYFSERRTDTSGVLKSVCYRFSDTQNTNDYNDHNKPIKFIYNIKLKPTL